MAQVIHKRLAEWLTLGEQRSFQVYYEHEKRRHVARLIGMNARGQRLTTLTELPVETSGVSGGGSAGTPIDVAINHWYEQAGWPEKAVRGAR